MCCSPSSFDILKIYCNSVLLTVIQHYGQKKYCQNKWLNRKWEGQKEEVAQTTDHVRCLHTKGKKTEVAEILAYDQACKINGKAEF